MKKTNNTDRTKGIFRFFKICELFRTCSNTEIIDCIFNNSIEKLMILLNILDEFREDCEIPIYITSSYRNIEHNQRVGGSETSQHLTGEAIDFYTTGMQWDLFCDKFLYFLRSTGYSRSIGQVIITKSYIHCALASTKHPNLQVYDKRTSKTIN